MSLRVALAALLTFLSHNVSSGAEWRIELVDKTGPGRSSAIKIDKEGNAHIAYVVHDSATYPLKYAFWDHRIKRWFVMQVDELATTCSIALDSQQRPHISYVEHGTVSGKKLRYAYWDGVAWKKSSIPLNSDIIAYFTSIVLNAKDEPSISFYEYRGPKETEIKIRLRVVTLNEQRWQVRTVDPQEGSGKFNSLAIAANGLLHLAYANVSAGTEGLRYATWDGAAWKLEKVDGSAENGGDSVGHSVMLALDKQSDPHIAYMNQSSPGLKYAVRRQGRWLIENVDAVSAVGYPDRNSIAVDADGVPHIGYYDGGRGLLKIAHKQGTRWVTEIVDSSAAGFTSAIAIDGETIWVSYSDEGGNGLKVARSQLSPKTLSEAVGPGKADESQPRQR